MSSNSEINFDWFCKPTWMASAYNTMWCLIGCSIGDFGTIYYFQVTGIPWTTLNIMLLAMFNGILTSIILETIILLNQMGIAKAFKTAIGMSLISMVSMEIAMNSVDVLITGGAELNLFVLPIMLIVGFLTPWPYNNWRLKKFGISCCPSDNMGSENLSN